MFDLRIPVATYRIQFNRQFRFEDAQELVPYLSRLGISDLYASPIFKARRGSSHGYDVTDPTSLNPELGTEKDFNILAGELGQRGMGLLLDVVPNHMAAIQENERAWENFQRYSGSYQRIRIAYIDGARDRPGEYEKRLKHLIKMTEQDKQFGRGIEDYY